MRGLLTLSLIGLSLSAGPVTAALDLAALDFKDYDNDLMRDLDKTIKYFEPDITAKNIDGAREDGEMLLNGFRYAESYFLKKGAQDAVEISRQGIKLVGDALKNVEQNEFDAAAAAARGTPQLCKSCHDLYKPRLAR